MGFIMKVFDYEIILIEYIHWWFDELCNYFIRLLKMPKIMVLLILPTFSLFFIIKYK